MRIHLLLVLAVTVLFGTLRAADEPVKDLEKLAGTWAATAAEDYGEKLPADQITNLLLVISGDEFASAHGDTTVMAGTFTIDFSKKPKTIDFKSTSGRHKGKTLLGLYELDGDSLKICFVEPGGKRPKDMTSTLENSAFLLAYERKKR